MTSSDLSDEFIAYAAQLYLPEIPGLDWLPVCRQWAAKVREPGWLRDSGISPGWEKYQLYADYYKDPLSVALAVAWKALILTHYEGSPLGGNVRWHSWQGCLIKLMKARLDDFLQRNAEGAS